MKNIFKLMGLALMACSLTFVACSKDDEENNNPNDNPTVADGITVTFDGDSWTGSQNANRYYAQYGALQFTAATSNGNYPMFDEAIYSAETGAITEAAAENGYLPEGSTHSWVEYYAETTLQDGSGNNYGDWWAAQATTDIKAIDLTTLKVTAQMEGTMFSAKEAFIDGLSYSGASRAPYSATFGNVSLTNAK